MRVEKMDNIMFLNPSRHHYYASLNYFLSQIIIYNIIMHFLIYAIEKIIYAFFIV